MGWGGCRPMLHVGEMQDAVTVVPPALVLLTAPAVLTVATSGWLELQVRSGAIAFPEMSKTPLLMVAELPLAALMTVPPVFATAKPIDCTGQVLNVIGTLLVLAIEANS